MKCILIGAETDLGVHIDGTKLGPVQLINDVRSFYKGEIEEFKQDDSIIKSRNLSDRSKNKYDINLTNEKIYKTILQKMEQGYFPLTIGGDASVSIASVLADKYVTEEIGVILISAHANYYNFENTTSGNIANLSFSAITGNKCQELTFFHKDELVDESKAFVIGPRSMADDEATSLKYSPVTCITTEELREKGIEATINNAFEIASRKSKGVHVIFSLDIIDPEYAPGVSIPVFEGITSEEALLICEAIEKNFSIVSGFDLVDLNPLRDVERKTEQIAVNILAKITKKIEELPEKEIVKEEYY